MHDALFDGLVLIEPGRRDARRLGDRGEIDGALLFDEQSDSSFRTLFCCRCLSLGMRAQAVSVTLPLFGAPCHTCSSCSICSSASMSGWRLATSCSHFSLIRT